MRFVDIETYSELDITEVGTHAYAAHPSTEVLLICWANHDNTVKCWDSAEPHGKLEDVLARLLTDSYLCAHNATFERVLLNRFANPINRTAPSAWDDTAVLARTCGLPGKLERVCDVLNVEPGKKKAKGMRLINTFSKPAPKNHKAVRYTAEDKPDDWQEFIDYCKQDVVACRELWNTLPKHVYARERTNWILDQQISDTGIPVDLKFIDAALVLTEEQLALADAQINDITYGEVPTITATAKLAKFCGMSNVDKASVDTALARRDLDPVVRQALELRQIAGKSSIAKYARAKGSALNGRVHDALMFYGAARTGRESGQIIQPQNMKRPTLKAAEMGDARAAMLNGTVALLYDDPIGVASSLTRAMIAAPSGKKFVVSDLSNIEGRSLAWLAREEWKLDTFRAFDRGEGPDIYKATYAKTFGIDVIMVTSAMRQLGKVEELAFGYQGALGAFHTMSTAAGISLPDSQVLRIVEGWRKAHPKIVKLWYAVQDAALYAVKNPGKRVTLDRLKFGVYTFGTYSWLVITLPSGRSLFYYDPKIESGQVTYIGQIIGGTWGRISSYGGKFVENINQAIARDILFEGMRAANDLGYVIVLHSHDEIVAECPDTDAWNVEALGKCLTMPETWRDGMPLAAAGYQDYFYRKD